MFKAGKVLLRLPKANASYRGKIGWSLPKGWLDDDSSGLNPGDKASGKIRATESDLEEAALREVAEEAGVKAKVVSKLPTVRWFYKNIQGETVMKFVTYFQMEWVSDLPGGFGDETSEVQWMDVGEAMKSLLNKNEAKVLELAAKV